MRRCWIQSASRVWTIQRSRTVGVPIHNPESPLLGRIRTRRGSACGSGIAACLPRSNGERHADLPVFPDGELHEVITGPVGIHFDSCACGVPCLGLPPNLIFTALGEPLVRDFDALSRADRLPRLVDDRIGRCSDGCECKLVGNGVLIIEERECVWGVRGLSWFYSPMWGLRWALSSGRTRCLGRR